jgi:hypothetical protein
VLAPLLAALLATEPPVLPPVPVGPPGGAAPIVVEPIVIPPATATARLHGTVRGEDFELELSTVTLELECIDCTRAPARVRPDLRGEFEFWGIEPGAYRLIVEQQGRTTTRELTLAADEHASIELVIPRPPPVPELPAELADSLAPADPLRAHARPRDEGQTLRRAGLATTVLGTALGIGGVLVATMPPCGNDGTRGANCDVDIRNTIGLVLGVSAAGAVTAGVVSMVLGRSLQRQQRIEAGIMARRGSGGLVLVGRF